VRKQVVQRDARLVLGHAGQVLEEGVVDSELALHLEFENSSGGELLRD
jgi:hypothetical protein